MVKNNFGFTLVELLATMIIIGVIVGITVPNIIGISNQNKATKYAEDARKMKNSAEYLFRGDNSFIKPVKNGQCIAINLDFLDNDEYEESPYDGKYLKKKSFVIIKKENRRYKYFVQLIEELPGSDGYRGFQLTEFENLEDGKYFDQLEDFNNDIFTDLSVYANVARKNELKNVGLVRNCNCNEIMKVYAS